MSTRRVQRRAGFTLVESLAALAIAAAILVAAAGLFNNVALNFDRGTRGVSEAERFVLAVDRLSADLGSARFVSRTTNSGPALAFVGQQESADGPAMIKFVAAGGVAVGPQGEEIVSLSVEQTDEITRLIRRRFPWRGPRTRFEDVIPTDPVILLEGNYDIAFAFGRLSSEGVLSWVDSWTNQTSLPRSVRLTVTDRRTGSNLLAGAEFAVRADCGRTGNCGVPAQNAPGNANQNAPGNANQNAPGDAGQQDSGKVTQ